MVRYDFIVVGAGITGLAVSRELTIRFPNSKILILEKENKLGAHSSGRNSGVLHSGIYYPSDSLKAQFCSNGRALMSKYCQKNKIPYAEVGKVIVPTKEEDDFQIDILAERAVKNGAEVDVINEKHLKKIEPFVKSASNRALYSPKTAVVDPKSVLESIKKNLVEKGVEFKMNSSELKFEPESKQVIINENKYTYRHLFNTAGQNADRIARLFGIGEKYKMMPFKGLYYKLSEKSSLKFSGLVYPVPDMNMPFLGVHTVKTVKGDIYFGPTAIPALGRENYKGFKGIDLSDFVRIGLSLVSLYWRNNQHFRNYTHAEAGRFLKSKFTQAARSLIPDLKKSDLLSCDKVGIRTQLLDTEKHELVMDFLVERSANETHILNVVSPGFTSSMSFAKYIVDKSSLTP